MGKRVTTIDVGSAYDVEEECLMMGEDDERYRIASCSDSFPPSVFCDAYCSIIVLGGRPPPA